ncbi:MAG: putative lipid II flippase FtsW [Pseudomonadales bacterium]
MTMAMTNHSTSVARDCPVDPVIAGTATILVTIGLVMVASATTEISARTFGDPFYMFTRHLVFLTVGIGIAGATLMLPLRVLHRVDWIFLLLAFVLLIAVLIPGIGREVNGSMRWIPLGPVSIQGSEIVKLFVIVYIAGYLVRRKEEVHSNILGFINPLLLVSALVLLLLEQPDFGAAIVLMAVSLGIIFMAGVPIKRFFPIISVCMLLTAILAVWQPYRLERLTSFTNPWEHQLDGGYQLTQALIAFGRGEFFGLGLGNSIQKLFFLPEAHTDFLFSIIAEELGAVGALLVTFLFCVLVIRGFWIGRLAYNQGSEFNAYIAFGVSLLLGIQSAINIGVNLGLLPTKGLTLPLMSFGGNSLVLSCLLIGLLLRVEFETREEPLVNKVRVRSHGK